MSRDTLSDKVFAYLRSASNGSIMLTGGCSAAKFYHSWASPPNCITEILGAKFYFSDERCVSLGSSESNYNAAVTRLFPNGVPINLCMHRIEAERFNSDSAANFYADLLPASIDLLLLSVGEDGHIASLFPYSPALHETQRLVVPVVGLKAPFHRITITPLVIKSAKEVIVIAEGKKKREVYEKALLNPNDIDAIPARLVLNRTWLFN